jgi:murein DD-endopeptidase MepM/ murein hydrolase activator NlpD
VGAPGQFRFDAKTGVGQQDTVTKFVNGQQRPVTLADYRSFQASQPQQRAPQGTPATQFGGLLTPNQFSSARQELGVGETDFDRFFKRQGQDILFKTTGLGGTTALKPNEFTELRQRLGVGQDNFDVFFRRDGNDIFFKPDALFGKSLPQFKADTGQVTTGAFKATSKTATEAFSSDVLTGPEVLIPDETGTPQNMNAFVDSIGQLYERAKTDLQKQFEEERARIKTDLESKIDQLGTKAKRFESLNQEFGIKEKFSQMEELSLQIEQRMAEYGQAANILEDQTIPVGLLRGQQAALQRQGAVEIGLMQGTLSALQGNFMIANDLIDRSLAVEFEPLEQQIAATFDFLGLNERDLLREESKQLNAVEKTLQERQRVLEEKKQEKQFIKDLMFQLAEIGGDPQLIDFNAPLQDNLAVFAKEAERFRAAERKFEIEQAKALSGKQLITDAFGKPVGTFDQLTGETTTFGADGYVSSIGPVTAYGSYDEEGNEVWAPGLDIDLAVGDEIYSPVSGVVSDVLDESETGGFGNQVKVIDENGNELWFSHLQAAGVTVGQEIKAGQFLATGGNSGTVIPINGGDGSHLDLTIRSENGTMIRNGMKFMTAHEVERYVNEMSQQAGVSQPSGNVFDQFDFDVDKGVGGQDEKEVAKQQKSLANAMDAVEVINKLETHPGFESAVGFKTGGSLLEPLPFIDNPIPGTKAADFVSEVTRLKAILSADRIEILRGLGAMSERELAVVTDSATSLDRNMSEEAFKTELGRIKDVMNRVINRAQSGETVGTGAQPVTGDSLDDFLNSL